MNPMGVIGIGVFSFGVLMGILANLMSIIGRNVGEETKISIDRMLNGSTNTMLLGLGIIYVWRTFGV